MLTEDQLYVLSLLRKCLKGESEEDYSSIDNQAVASIIVRNGILLTVYPKLPADLQKLLSRKYYAAFKQSVVQEYEGKSVLKALSDAGFKCIALKGWELKELYPERTMRQMADLDILVRPYDFEKIKSVMDRYGFASGSESSWKHDGFKKNEVTIEIHKRLTDDSGAVQAWERGLWDRAKAADGNIYRMSPEDFCIFHYVHFHKDFMNGSLGLRRIADTWLLQKQPVDMKTVKVFLKSFGMWEFCTRMVKLSHVTMGDKPLDEDSEVLLSHAFVHGIYGSGKSYKTGRIAAMGGSLQSGKLKSIIAAVFLPYKRMKAQFPILEKWPVLLPYCWIKRIIRVLKGNLKESRRMLDYSTVSKADYEEMRRFFKAGGVKTREAPM